MPAVLPRLFAGTTGKISMFDPVEGVELLSRDFNQFSLFSCFQEDAMLDTVTEDGEAIALFMPGNGYIMYPPPSLILDGGGLYLNDGEPMLGQPRDHLFLPADILGELDGLPFYSLKHLKVKEVEALAPPKARASTVDPIHLKGKSEHEKKHLLELHDRLAFGLRGNHACIIWHPDKSKSPKFLTVKDAREREGTRIVHVKGEGGGTRKLNMFNEWNEWTGRDEYDEIKFAPGERSSSLYNLFFGWNVRPRHGDWARLRDHIRLTICNGNHEHFQWFMAWLSHIFQQPGGRKPPVAVVIRGKKGTGKSIVFDFVQQLMPSYFFKAADAKRALGNFNAQYETTLLLLMEEALWAGDPAKESVLKDLISSSTLPIERKGVDAYMAKNHMRIAMLSNERWVVPASSDERRYAVLDCNDEHRGDSAYFQAISDQMEAGGLAAMLYDLLTFEPEGGWSILNTAPATSGLTEQKVETLRGIDRFMYELVTAGMYECDDLDEGGLFLRDDAPVPVSVTQLRAAVRDYLADHYPGHKAASHALITRAVQEWFGAEVETRRARTNNVRWVIFPPLPECRDHVRRVKGIEIDPPTRH